MIKILLADDQFLILEGIKAILEHESEIEVVGTAQDGQTAIAQVKKLRPDILLIDIEMPKMNGIVATKYICKYLPDTRVIVLTSHESQDYIAQALLAGASGYLLKNSLIDDLKQAIYSLGSGNSCTKVKLLTKEVNKNRTTNVVKYQQKIIYLRKYRKSIYRPAHTAKKTQLSRTLKPSQTNNKILLANLKSSNSQSIDSMTKFNRYRYLKMITWLLSAIAGFVLAIMIF